MRDNSRLSLFHKYVFCPKNSDRLRNHSIIPVIASTRRVRGNLSAIMRDCFTSFAMTTFLSLFLGLSSNGASDTGGLAVRAAARPLHSSA